MERYKSCLEIDIKYSAYNKAIGFLSKCLCKAYNKNAIILMDEYDVYLKNSYFNKFYNKMIDLLRSVFESALKTNNSLEFAGRMMYNYKKGR